MIRSLIDRIFQPWRTVAICNVDFTSSFNGCPTKHNSTFFAPPRNASTQDGARRVGSFTNERTLDLDQSCNHRTSKTLDFPAFLHAYMKDGACAC